MKVKSTMPKSYSGSKYISTPYSLALINILLLSKLTLSQNTSTTCLLSQNEPMAMTPSLKECFQFTKSSCCTLNHDNQISNDLGGLVSPACQENFDELLQYYCFGCYSSQPAFTDTKKKEIRVCRDFANRMWGGQDGDLDVMSRMYDTCGLNINNQILIQSKYFTKATDLFTLVKPSFFEDYKIVIVQDNDNCFNQALFLNKLATIGSVFLAIIIIFTII